MKMNIVEAVLAQHFTAQGWHITTPPAGVQKESYIAESERHKLFVKFDVATPAWQRLAAIGVTPPLLFTGTHAGRPYIVQAYVEGTYPDRAWFAQHIPALAHFIKRYHTDEQLIALLSTPGTQPYKEHIQHEVVTLERALMNASHAMFAMPHTHAAVEQFKQQSKQLQPVPYVPVHADPSPVNMLVTAHGLTMVDWDDVLLSDPLRDVGLIVWWYLPRNLWPSFFGAYGTPMDQQRLFWWVAKRSLELALWLDQRGAHEQALDFLADFARAVWHQDNPQAVV